MRQDYAECERRVLLSEGGYTNDPRDPGGPTNWGITIKDARAYWKPNATAEDVRAMPQSVASQIYKPKYWDAVGGDDLPAGVDYVVFDYGVNSGVGRSLRVYNALKTDDPVQTIHAICDERLAFLKRLPTWGHFGAGWAKRVAAVRLYADHMASEAAGAPPEHPTDLPACGKAYGDDIPIPTPDPRPNPTQEATQNAQGSPVVRPNVPPATQPPEMPKTHWWKPWAAIGLGGSGGLDWLSQANDYADQLATAKDHLEHFHVSAIPMWVVEHPMVLLPIAAVILGAWLWEDHKKTKALIEELEKERQCSPQ